MRPATLALIVGSLAILTVGIVIFFTRYPTTSNEAFTDTSRNLEKLRADLRTFLAKSLDKDGTKLFDIAFPPGRLAGVVQCVEGRMRARNIALDSFNMDGLTMDIPILEMSARYSDTYKILAQCGFLKVIGKLIAISTWLARKSDPSNFGHFLTFLDTVPWTNAQVWKSMSDPNGVIQQNLS